MKFMANNKAKRAEAAVGVVKNENSPAPSGKESKSRHGGERRCWVLAIIMIVIVVVAVIVALIAILIGHVNSRTEMAESSESFSSKYTVSDAIRFKEEYEALNNTLRESDSATYGAVEIAAENPIVYITPEEALTILNDDQAVIYVGAEWCPWCRNAVPVLLDVAKQYGTEKLYYLNLDDYKSEFKIQGGELVTTRKGSDAYYRLLEKLKDKLRDYTITGENGETYSTGEKRIYQPHVFGIKNGAVVADKSGTVDLDDGQTKYDPLTSAQKSQLREDYLKVFREVYGEKMETCSTTEQACDQELKASFADPKNTYRAKKEFLPLRQKQESWPSCKKHLCY